MIKYYSAFAEAFAVLTPVDFIAVHPLWLCEGNNKLCIGNAIADAVIMKA